MFVLTYSLSLFIYTKTFNKNQDLLILEKAYIDLNTYIHTEMTLMIGPYKTEIIMMLLIKLGFHNLVQNRVPQTVNAVSLL